MAIRILIAEPDPTVRKLLRALLDWETDLQVVGEAADGPEALLVAEETRPAVVLLADLLANLACIEDLKAMSRPPRVVILATYREGVVSALAAGADHSVLKDASVRELADIIRRLGGEWPGLDTPPDEPPSGADWRRP